MYCLSTFRFCICAAMGFSYFIAFIPFSTLRFDTQQVIAHMIFNFALALIVL